MKASELRIGNYVHMDMSIDDIEVVRLKIGDLALFAIEATELYPIPLTEEWLLKFGFYEKYKSSSNRWNIKWFELHDCEDIEGNLTGVFMYDFRIQVKHVHQLQNLYFALTNEEL